MTEKTKGTIGWILGVITAVIGVSLSAWLSYVYGAIDSHGKTLAAHESRIGYVESCAVRNYDYLKLIDAKVDKLISMHIKDEK